MSLQKEELRYCCSVGIEHGLVQDRETPENPTLDSTSVGFQGAHEAEVRYTHSLKRIRRTRMIPLKTCLHLSHKWGLPF